MDNNKTFRSKENIENTLKILKYLNTFGNVSSLDEGDDALNSCILDENVSISCAYYSKLLARSLSIYSEGFSKCFTSSEKIEIPNRYIIDNGDVEFSTSVFVLPKEVDEISNLPAIAEIIGTLIHLLKSGHKTHLENWQLQILESFIITVEENIKYCLLDSIENEEDSLRILISILCKMFMTNDWGKDYENILVHIKCIIEHCVNYIGLFDKTKFVDSKYVSIICNYGLSHYLNSQFISKKDIESCFDRLWGIMKDLYKHSQSNGNIESLNAMYFLLCFLLSLQNNLQPSFKICDVILDPQLWAMLVDGLMQVDFLLRKRSQRSFKRIFDICQMIRNEDFEALTLVKNQEFGDNPILKTLLNESHSSVWIEYFIILETLEEPQSHLIKPLYPKILLLYNRACCCNCEIVPLSYILVLFKRLLNHCNKNIQRDAFSFLITQRIFSEASATVMVKFSLVHLLSTLQNTCLFCSGTSETKINESIASELPKFMETLYLSCDKDTKKVFLRGILSYIFDGRAWSSVSLFYLIRSIPTINSRTWSYGSILLALQNYQGNLSTHDQVIRSSIQCHFIKLILAHSKDLSILQLSSILKYFNYSESWKRGSPVWVSILRYFIEREITNDTVTIKNCIKQAYSINKGDADLDPVTIAVAVVILGDILAEKGIENAFLYEVLNQAVSSLKDCDARPYINKFGSATTIECLSTILKILCDSVDQKDNEQTLLLLILQSEEVFHSLMNLLLKLDICGENDPLCLVLLTLFSSIKVFSNSSFEKLVNYHKAQLFQYLTSTHKSKCAQDDCHIYFDICKFVIENFEFEPMLNVGVQDLLKKPLPSNDSKIFSIRSFWDLLVTIAKKDPLFFSECFASDLPVYIKSSCRDTAVPIFKLTSSLISLILKENILELVVSSLMEAAKEHRSCCIVYRTLLFYSASVVFHPEVISSSTYHDLIIKKSKELIKIGENVLECGFLITLPLIDTLSSNSKAKESFTVPLIEEIFLPIIQLGAVYPKQWKLSRDTIAFIQKFEPTANVNTSDYESIKKGRALLIRFFISNQENNSVDTRLMRDAASAIMSKFPTLTTNRRIRDFPNSFAHHSKTRLMQFLLLTIPFLKEEDGRHFLPWTSTTLAGEQQLPSVRFLLEWSLALLILKFMAIFPEFLLEFDKNVTHGGMCTASFIVSLSLIGCMQGSPELLEVCLEKILPWTMSNNYNIRLYAQASVKNIWKKVMGSDACMDLMSKYSPLYNCLFSLENTRSDEFKNLIALTSEFYFSALHPLKHYSVQTIFYEIPRLAEMVDSEWLSQEFISNLDHYTGEILPLHRIPSLVIHCSIPLSNPDSKLQMLESPLWIKRTGGKVNLNNEDERAYEGVKNVQKKVTHWKSVPQDFGLRLNSANEIGDVLERSSIIIVASLVDKLPNLGGLCRSCEIFGVKEFVVSSVAITKDPSFTSLSLTAHQWINMKEVKSNDVAKYLLLKKHEGYYLVGLEQTANSCNLQQFQFPKQSVVLLGNEKEGIPCNLLQMMDACIEIPQSGVLRSLNVHVSGAIVLWEYYKQNGM